MKNENALDAIRRRISGIEYEMSNLLKERFAQLRRDIMTCEQCGDVMLADRAGKKKYCSDICRVTAGRNTPS